MCTEELVFLKNAIKHLSALCEKMQGFLMLKLAYI